MRWPWQSRPRSMPPPEEVAQVEADLAYAHRRLDDEAAKAEQSSSALRQIADDIRRVQVRVHAVAKAPRTS